MSSDSIPLLIVFILFVLCGGYFSGTESAFTALNKIKIKNKAEEGNRRAKHTMYIVNNFEHALSTILIGNNVARTAAASVATVIAAREFSDVPNSALWTTVITTLIFFFFSEMIPKAFANDRSDSTALFFAGSMRFLMKVLGPIARFFAWISGWFSRLFSSGEDPSITEEELIDIIDTAEEEGVVDADTGEMLRSAIDFATTTVEDVMTMREDICAIDVTLSPAAVLDYIRDNRRSRIPVYEGDIDHVIGILQVRKFLKQYYHDKQLALRPLLSEPYFLSPTALIDDQLDRMSRTRHYLGIVRDDEGHTVGLVTVEDFLEEIVGEIWDEEDVVNEDFFKLGGNRFSVSGACDYNEMLTEMGLAEYHKETSCSVGAWALARFGRLPEEEESFVKMLGEQYLIVTVDEIADNRIARVIVKLDDEDPEAAEAEEADVSGKEALV
ncbi:MAG: HlyC/CorC family transporter [Clostridia bacterium]|nr:HlyC/CorC family transporter [Clostridia bacterium]